MLWCHFQWKQVRGASSHRLSWGTMNTSDSYHRLPKLVGKTTPYIQISHSAQPGSNKVFQDTVSGTLYLWSQSTRGKSQLEINTLLNGLPPSLLNGLQLIRILPNQDFVFFWGPNYCRHGIVLGLLSYQPASKWKNSTCVVMQDGRACLH